MKVQLALALEKITSSFWVIPTFIILVLTFLLFVLKGTHVKVEELFLQDVLFLRADADAARLLLSSIATSIMTVTGVLFSIVVLVIEQMSTQYTPRVVSNFTRSTTAQLVLGFFAGTFVYSLILLMNIGKTDSKNPIPHLALTFAVLLSITCLILLIFYIHNVTKSIQSTEIIANIAREAISSLRNVVKDRKEANVGGEEKKLIFGHSHALYSDKTGYIDALNWKLLPRYIKNNAWKVEFHRSPGDFIQKETKLLTIWTENPCRGKKIEKIFKITPMRTNSQDPGYGIQKLSDIALKGLSPGINDPSTAIESLHSITAILLEYLKKFPLPEKIFLEENKLVVFVPTDPRDIIRESYNAVLTFSKEHGRVKELIRQDLQFIRDCIHDRDLKEMLEEKLRAI